MLGPYYGINFLHIAVFQAFFGWLFMKIHILTFFGVFPRENHLREGIRNAHSIRSVLEKFVLIKANFSRHFKVKTREI